jgi:hypothetical protein
MQSNYLRFLLSFCLSLLSTKVVISESVTEEDGYLEYGVGRFEYSPSEWKVSSATISALDEDSFSFMLTSPQPGNSQNLRGNFYRNSFLMNSISESLETAFDRVSMDTKNTELQNDYFETSQGYPAGFIYYKNGFMNDTISAEVWIDLADSSTPNDKIFAHIVFTSTQFSIDQIKAIANGVMRYQGTPISSNPDDSGSSDKGDPSEDNSDDPENTIPIEDTLVCDFQDGPISICFPKDTLVDLYRSYSESGSWTQAHYLPGLNNAKSPSFSINSYTEMNYESLDDWASHVVNSWNLSEVNATISTNRFQTDSGFPGIWATREYSGLMGPNSFDYFIVIDLSTDAWKQRHLQNQYAEDADWLRMEFQGVYALTNEDEFETALAVAKSIDYNLSYIPQGQTYAEIGQDSFSPISLTKSFVDGPISFETPSDTLIDLYRSYSENGSWTQAHYLPGLNNAKSPSFSINFYTEMNYESLDDWASHVVNSWNLSEVNATISTNRFQTDSGFPGIWATREYSGLMGPNSFDYFIAIDLSTDAWKQRHLQNQYAEDADWLRMEFQGVYALTNEDEFETALAVAKSIDYNQSYIPNTITYVAKSTDLSTSTKLLVNELNSGWFFSEWLGAFFDGENGWIYHEDLEWLYWTDSSDGNWFWSNQKDWLWTSEDVFPYLYSDNSGDWIYLSISTEEEPKAYDYSTNSWTTWNDLSLVKQATAPLNNASSEEEAISDIFHSNTMSDKEKIDAIAKIILLGL